MKTRTKKWIVVAVFLALILFTVVYTAVTAVLSYRYDMETGVDIFAGMGAAITIVIGGAIVFYECDLFFTVYYFFVGKRTKTKTALHLISNGWLLFTFVGAAPTAKLLARAGVDFFKEETLFVVGAFLLYLLLRTVYLAFACMDGEAAN